MDLKVPKKRGGGEDKCNRPQQKLGKRVDGRAPGGRNGEVVKGDST